MSSTNEATSVVTVLTGGTVRPFGSAGPDTVHEAVAIKDGRVLAVGDEADVRSAAGPGQRVVDLDGAVVTPGLIDTHPHLFHWALLGEGLVDILDATNQREILDRISARAAVTPPGEWIMTTPVGEPHYFIRRSYRDLAEGELPDRWALDRAAPENPVWIQAWAPTTPNVTVFNSAGLAAIGVTRAAGSQVRKVAIERNDDGDPTGRIFGSVNNYYNNDPWWDSTLLSFPRIGRAHLDSAVQRGVQAANARGITTLYEAHWMDFETIDVYANLAAAGLLTARVSCVPDAEGVIPPFSHPADFPGNVPEVYPISEADFEARLRRARERVSRDGDMFRQDGVLLVNEAPVEIGMLYMRNAYLGPHGETTSGTKFYPNDRLRKAMEFCAENDMRLSFLAAGARAHDDFLDVIEDVAGRHPAVREKGWLLEHGYLVDQRQAERYAALNISATLSCSFSWGAGKVFRDRMGPQVLPDLIPLRRLLDVGMPIGGGSDWGPESPFEHMELAQTHRICGTDTGNGDYRNDGPAQGITRGEAYEMWTSGAATVLQWDGIGSLAPGNHADLVVLGQDPLTCDVQKMIDTPVLATLLGGRPVHDEAQLFT